MSYEYSASTTDVEGDALYYQFNWGDDTYSDWLGPYNSGETCIASYQWSEAGMYEVSAVVRDQQGFYSDRSHVLLVCMGTLDNNGNSTPDLCELCTCGDLDFSGGPVDLADFGLFALCYNVSGPSGDCTAEYFECSDMDGSGLVDLADFGLFALWYGQESTQTTPNCVPQ
ncbi:unnamed protein product [marine sediment metagenome]|uniref:PKD domain-containing protein n=1 Tax=marine sediment metagenome TaxID=412755 RepID=X0UDA0_9ZZZZ